jgi:hypothetical protein
MIRAGMKRLFLEHVEECTKRHANRLEAAFTAGMADSLEDGTLELAFFKAGSDTPDMTEGDHGEFAAQTGSNTNSGAECGQFVTKSQPTVKAGV